MRGIRQFGKIILKAAANFRSPSEGVAEGGGWGEEFRHARAKNRGRPRRPARQNRALQKSFLFLLEEKIGCAQIRKCKENFFVGRAGFRHGGGAASLGVLLKMGSSKVQNFPLDAPLCEKACSWFSLRPSKGKPPFAESALGDEYARSRTGILFILPGQFASCFAYH